MQLSLCPQPLYPLARAGGGLVAVLEAVRELGLRALELPVDGHSPLVDMDELLAGGWKRLTTQLGQHGLALSALSLHQEGQLLLGPHHADTDAIHAGSPAEKSAFAAMRLAKAAELARRLEVPVVVGFVGCEDYTRFFPWPDPRGWEKMQPVFRARVLAVLEHFERAGVTFAQEPHPKQFVYNTETALESVELLDGHPCWGFNLDPANLMLAGVDSALFVQELGARIRHVHAKDGELVLHNAARSGLLAHGPWDRPGRGFRFRIPGWGDVPWKRLLSTLALVGYDGYLALENEDPIFAPREGLEKAIRELEPLLPRGPRPKEMERWW
jgi:sugar phosphate isomerase/epimerase